MMKSSTLFVQIPAFNEAETIAAVIKSVPRQLPHITSIKILVIDDGSTDATSIVSRKAGADYVFTHKRNLGLAQTFQDGLIFCLNHGADIIVNTDADNQYDQQQITDLITPLLTEQADIVTGNRQVDRLHHMSLDKKFGNQLGSLMIRLLTGSRVADASSGFRAYSAAAAQKLNVYARHTYTHETLIQAHYLGLKVVEVPVTFNKRPHGGSRLIGSTINHIRKSVVVILRSILMYQAYTWLSLIAAFLTLLGLAGFIRFLYFFFTDSGSGHIQSLILSSMLISLGFTSFVLGLIADLVSINRRLLEKLNSPK